uniref:Uncharacterized protein n=1 Tax=Lactuca sativa TaxID=4236 RepID=A0A9R1UFR4_LACSA|nr:hypothetical protein LSAT_V11C900503410 [Lactuca sativa]
MSLQASRSKPRGISDILFPSFNQRFGNIAGVFKVISIAITTSVDPLEEQKKIARALRFSGTQKATVLSETLIHLSLTIFFLVTLI